MMFSCRQQKMCLIKMLTGCYFSPAATLLAVGRENPVNTKATTSASCAFFIVATLFALVPFYGLVRRLSLDSKGFKITTGVSGHHVMVAQAGQLSGWPGSFVSGILTPVWAIASERENSSDSFMLITKENCHHAQTSQKSHPKSAIRHFHSPTQLRLSAQAGPRKTAFISFVHRNTGWQSSSSIHSLYFFLHPR
ncbi:host cell division inhibitor Icd-like protein [Salmonella enterica]|nr:host cell division inhibitor Icd-like protein [Salmonella enterica]EDU1499353.1 ash family protein [Salmonella enterica subsp. enterica serovar Gaminara]EAM8463353.1 host cell division inhibitor Icd-like protein [Salmonella enterica]EAO7521370.1 host cell division inhibitor Icd-like protein [Salmonella enterica]EAW6600848.1 host cell division inhibitor Icd-like protein [Salmonella enterica]